jgi:hypothetical protein
MALFPGLLDRLNDVREVRVTNPDGKLTVTATDSGWSLAEKAGYPVDPAQVRNLALALANLQLVEPKTADPQRLRRLQLDEPGGEGTVSRRVELVDSSGAPLAAAIVGKPSPSLYGGGRGGVYVRRVGDNQAWLAAGELERPNDAMALVGREVIDLPVDEVARVVMRQPEGGAAATLSRGDRGTDFASDVALPEGRKLDPAKVESLAGALGGLTMTDVRPAAEIAPGNSPQIGYATFAGGTVDVTVTTIGDGETAEHWVTLQATDPIGDTPASGQSNRVPGGRKLDGWAFKVPPYVAERLTLGLDQLLAEQPSGS